jgi:hypothetical protein
MRPVFDHKWPRYIDTVHELRHLVGLTYLYLCHNTIRPITIRLVIITQKWFRNATRSSPKTGQRSRPHIPQHAATRQRPRIHQNPHAISDSGAEFRFIQQTLSPIMPIRVSIFIQKLDAISTEDCDTFWVHSLPTVPSHTLT